MRKAIPWLGLAAALSACASPPPPPAPGPELCVGLFQGFDRLERDHDLSRQPDFASMIPDPLRVQAQRLRQARCITTTADLARLEAVPALPIAQRGAAIVPTVLHVGVVTDMADDARALEFFRARGLRAYSIGNPALGRRVYVGPVATAGAAADVALLAREAGFIAPYLAQN